MPEQTPIKPAEPLSHPAMPAVPAVAMPVAPAPPPETPTQQVASAPEPLPAGISTSAAPVFDAPVLPAASEPLPDIGDVAKKLKDTHPSVPPPVAPSGPHAPVGIIVTTVMGMIVLCGLAIAVYLTSQQTSL